MPAEEEEEEEEAGAALKLVSRWGSPLQATAAQAEHAVSLLGCGAGTYAVCAQGRREIRLRKALVRAKSSGGDGPHYCQGMNIPRNR